MNYKELDVWKESINLATQTFNLLADRNSDSNGKLLEQIRKSAVSVPSNIAEASRRFHKKDSLRFLHIARGSIFELETQLIIARNLNVITDFELSEIQNSILNCIKLLQGFIKYYKNSDFK